MDEATGAVPSSCKGPEANKSLNGRRDSNDTASWTVGRSTCSDVLYVASDDTDIAVGHAIARSAGLHYGMCPSTCSPSVLFMFDHRKQLERCRAIL